MPEWTVDAVLALLTLGMTYALYSEGLWGATLMTFNVLFSALIALNFYEPVAKLLASSVEAVGDMADLICLGGFFVISLIGLRSLTGVIAPKAVRLPALVEQIGRIVVGFAGSALTIGFLLVMLQVAPVDRKILGTIDYKHKPPFGWGFDHKLLGFFQYVTGKTFPSYSSARDDPFYGHAQIFDPYGRWLIDRQNFRPFHGDAPDTVPEPEPTAQPATQEAGAGGSGGSNAQYQQQQR